MISSAVSLAEGNLGRGINHAAFENRSTTTRMTVLPWEGGSPVMKSRERCDHGLWGMVKGCNSPPRSLMCSFSLAAHRAGLCIDLVVLLDGWPPKPPLEEIKRASITRMARQGGLMTPLQDPGLGRLRDVQSRWTTSWVWA